MTVYVPRLFLIEFISVAKRLGIKISKIDVEELVSDFEVLSEDTIFDEAFRVAELVHPSGFVFYCHRKANKLYSRIVRQSYGRQWKKYGIEAYYLLEELDEVLRVVERLRN